MTGPVEPYPPHLGSDAASLPGTSGPDDGIRAALDSLIHDRDDPELDAPAAGPPRREAEPRRASLEPSLTDGLTGLHNPVAWTHFLTAENARWARYRRPCQLLQLEVGGIATVAQLFGEASAERLLVLLAGLLREGTRRSDLYARQSPWRIQGILAETDASAASGYVTRLRREFERSVGPDLHLRLVIGIAGPGAEEDLAAALLAAGQAMHRDGHSEAGSTSAAPGMPGDKRIPVAGVHAALSELERIHSDGLIGDDEYRAKHGEILDRL